MWRGMKQARYRPGKEAQLSYDRKLIARMVATVNPTDESFTRWIAALEAKHLAELTFPEASRALRALSSTYIEGRQQLARGGGPRRLQAAVSRLVVGLAVNIFYGILCTRRKVFFHTSTNIVL